MISIYCGKVEDLLSNFRSDFFDACLCDPPYGLRFMGKSWDHGVPSAAIWKLVRQTLKPGAPILAFGGTRTYHRLAVAIEDAGFEIFDSVLGSVWLYGQGFPKSLDIGKAIDKAAGAEREKTGTRIYGNGHIQRSSPDKLAPPIGTFKRTQDLRATSAPATDHARAWDSYGTALKPAWEPIVFARKPLSGTYAANCIEHGCGGLNIDGSRISTSESLQGSTVRNDIRGGKYAQGHKPNPGDIPQYVQSAGGRYPANLILSHHPECEDTSGCHPECPVAALDRQSGTLTSGKLSPNNNVKACSGWSGGSRADRVKNTFLPNSGGASRFFYCAKVSTSERNHGLPAGVVCDHPTLKPIDLCRYLATLILPPLRSANRPRNLLVPFSGAGSEIIGATIAGWESITAIEKEESYVEQARYRIKGHTGVEASLWIDD